MRHGCHNRLVIAEAMGAARAGYRVEDRQWEARRVRSSVRQG
jgi:hypothetical protein